VTTTYTVKLVKGRRHIQSGTARPDLYVRSAEWEHAWNFEFKRVFITLGAQNQNLERRITKNMKESYDELRQLAKGNGYWGDYGCCALGLTIWMDAIVRAGKGKRIKDRWEKRWNDFQEYENDCLKLWQEFETALHNKDDELTKFGKVYYSGYAMSHSLARTFYKEGKNKVHEKE